MHEHISELISQFQRAFDQHDWSALRACLDDEVFVDYSSFRGSDPSEVRADDYVDLRKNALGDLVMQHNHSQSHPLSGVPKPRVGILQLSDLSV